MILVCAATGIEAWACRRGLARASMRFEILRTGIGLQAAERSLRERLRQASRPSMIVSSGFAGALTDQIPIGTWIQGTQVRAEGSEPLDCATLPASQLVTAPFISVGNSSPAHRNSKVIMVDMESYALARISGEMGIPFYILRLVSDTPKNPLPRAILCYAQGNPGGIPRRLMETISEPLVFASFIFRSARLPVLLERGWERFSLEFNEALTLHDRISRMPDGDGDQELPGAI